MVIYEVNIQVLAEIYQEYIAWLKPHIQEMLLFQGFTQGKILKEKPLRGESASNDSSSDPIENYERITVHYYIDHVDNLDDYLNNHAPRMREDSLKRFPQKFRISRRFFEINEEIWLLNKE